MIETIIKIIGCAALASVVFPWLIVISGPLVSMFVDIFVDMWTNYMDIWKKAIEVIKQFLKGGDDGGGKKNVHTKDR